MSRKNSSGETPDLQRSIAWLRLFGDATRLRLLALLQDHELAVAELESITELPQSRVSTHLGKLRDAGLVHARRNGNSTLYRLHAAMPVAAASMWTALRQQLADTTLATDADRCEALLAARGSLNWPESVAGEMERHYSPGRTWEALVHGVAGLLDLGDVLDIGCGDGYTTQLVGPHCTSYVGLDRSDKVLAAARRRTDSGRVNSPRRVSPGSSETTVEFVRGTMSELPFQDASFDHVLMMHVLTFSEDPAVALSEAVRVLRSGGRLVLVTLDAHEHDSAAAYGHVHHGFELSMLHQQLRDAGLHVHSCAVTSRERRKPHYAVITAIASKHPAKEPA